MCDKTLCDNCIHMEVCNDEGKWEPAMKFCAEQIPKETFGFIRRSNGLLLSDVYPFIRCRYYTLLEKTGEEDNPDTYNNPTEYRVVSIDFDNIKNKIVIIVEPFKENT